MASVTTMFNSLAALLLAMWSAPAMAQVAKPPGGAMPAPASPTTVRIGGSSTVFPILEVAIAAYKDKTRNAQVRISLKETGTSAGFRQFCNGELAIANASRAINSRELRACQARGVRFIELPIAFDAITVVVNPANRWLSMLSIRQLGQLWGRQAQGKIKQWNQLNPAWPKQPINLCGPGKDSGTYDYFNKAVTGDEANARSDYFASEDDNVLVRCVAKDPNALGYFGYAYFARNRALLKPLMILGSKGMVAPTVASVQSENYVPLSRPLFLYINDQAIKQQPEARRFVTYVLQNGLRFVESAGYIPLPASTYRLVESKLYRNVLGSAFGGKQTVGESLSVTLQRSLEQVKRAQFR